MQDAVLSVYKKRSFFDKEKVIKMPKVLNIHKTTMSKIEDYVFYLKLGQTTRRHTENG